MKVKAGFELRTVAGEDVVVATGADNIDFSKLIAMNPTAAYLWRKIENIDSFTTDILAQLLIERYEVDHSIAHSDAQNIAQQWISAGVVDAS